MSIQEDMAGVLAGHQWYDATTDSEDPAIGCTGCSDWLGSEDALDDGTFAAHQAAQLAPLVEAHAQEREKAALRDAADNAELHGFGWPTCSLDPLDYDTAAAYTEALAINWLRARAEGQA